MLSGLPQQQLIEQLEKHLGIAIPLYNGAAVIHYDDGQEVNLDFSNQSSLFTIHSGLANVSIFSLESRKMQDILQLNGRIDILHGGWLGFHKESNSLRYFFSLPLQFTTVDTVVSIIDAILYFKKKIADNIMAR